MAYKAREQTQFFGLHFRKFWIFELNFVKTLYQQALRIKNVIEVEIQMFRGNKLHALEEGLKQF